MVPFGFGPSPYYCSGWSAECNRWVRHAQVPASVYMDDWATAGASHAAAVANMRTIKDLLEPCGILFNPSKDAVGKRVVYLGVLSDTIAMSLSFEATKASVHLDILRAHHATISRGSNLPHPEVCSIAGKLSWFAQVLQSGRLHTRSWWLYVVFGYRLLPPARARLLLDTTWWITICSVGSRSQRVATIPIVVSAHVLAGSIARLDYRLRRLRPRRPRLLLRPSIIQHARFPLGRLDLDLSLHVLALW